MHGVDPNVLRRKRIGEGPHEPDDAVLGRRVAEPAALEAAEALQACRRAGEDDRPAAVSREQMGNRGLRGVEGADEVDVDGGGPLVEFLLDTSVRETPSGAMPALASTMSRRPNCSTPASSGGFERWKSRTSATVPSILPPDRFHQRDRLVELIARLAIG